MKFDKSSNPTMGSKVFGKMGRVYQADGIMSISGTINKTIILLLIAVVTASLTWKMYNVGNTSYSSLMIFGLIGGLIMAFVTIFKPHLSHITAPIYAALEGFFLGGISAVFNESLGGVVLQAVFLTFTVFLVMLVLYKTGIVRATAGFQKGVMAATGGIVLFYLLTMVMRIFGVNMPYLHDGGIVSIGISLVIVGIAALNLILDFNQIEEGVTMGAPKRMEWYGAFGLMVTLVWLYLEILRLLSKLARD